MTTTKLVGAVLALTVAAVAVGCLAFGWPALLVGAPVLLGTVLTFVALRLSEGPRRRLREQRAARWAVDTPAAGGLMSGFFEPVGGSAPDDRR